MIWLMALGLALVVSVYLISPLIARDVETIESDEIAAYRAELRNLEQNSDASAGEITRLQTRLLQAAKADMPSSGQRSALLPVFVTLAIAGSGLGLYAKLGSPNFEPILQQQPPEQPPAQQGQDYASLLPRFEAQLAETPEDPTGWYLYGRTLMLAGQPTAGLRAYERSLELSDTPEVRKEYEAARTFAEQAKVGPSAEDIAAMQSLSEEERQAAISNMVNSLSQRLRETPNDPEGWERLLRSRKVLGQNEQAREDIEVLRQALPEQADSIISATGWDDLTPE